MSSNVCLREGPSSACANSMHILRNFGWKIVQNDIRCTFGAQFLRQINNPVSGLVLVLCVAFSEQKDWSHQKTSDALSGDQQRKVGATAAAAPSPPVLAATTIASSQQQRLKDDTAQQQKSAPVADRNTTNATVTQPPTVAASAPSNASASSSVLDDLLALKTESAMQQQSAPPPRPSSAKSSSSDSDSTSSSTPKPLVTGGGLKNVASWSKMFKSDTPSPALSNANATVACFEQFRKQAKEKEERRRQLKREEDVRKRAREIEERAAAAASPATRPDTKSIDIVADIVDKDAKSKQTSSVPPPRKNGDSGVAVVDDIAKQRERLRLQEQERRRRDALSNGVDMTSQMELMANFEMNF